MPSKLYYRAIIEDITNKKCSEKEMNYLINIFESVVKRMATMLARKSYYQLKDFSGTQEKGINEFSLTIERNCEFMEKYNYQYFSGEFLCGDKNLKLIASLEK